MATIDHDGVIELTRALIRVPSVNDPGRGRSEFPAAMLVAEQMRAFGWHPIVEEAAPGRPNVISVLDGDRPGPTLLFEGHTDVVTEGDSGTWSYDPFGANVVDGRLYGRGSADMKGGVAAMLHAAAALTAGGSFPGRVIVAALADEEGMMLGVKDFVRRGHAAGVDAAIVCEPEGGEVCVTQKGAMRVRVEVAGKMAHGAMPQHGHNPIPPLARFVAACCEVEQELQKGHGEHPLLGWDYVTPTVLSGGSFDQLNCIPGEAFAGLDIRTTTASEHAALLDRLKAAGGDEVELTVIEDRPPTETAVDHAIVRAMVAAHQQIHGEHPAIGGVPGTTDGTILWRDAAVPVVVYGPGGKWIAHQVDEYVELDDLVSSAEVFLEAARTFLAA